MGLHFGQRFVLDVAPRQQRVIIVIQQVLKQRLWSPIVHFLQHAFDKIVRGLTLAHVDDGITSVPRHGRRGMWEVGEHDQAKIVFHLLGVDALLLEHPEFVGDQ